VLKNIWHPSRNYVFPLLEKNKLRGLKCQFKWLDQYAWLAYSEDVAGLFCKYCVVFARTGGMQAKLLGQLVLNCFNSYAKATAVNFLNSWHYYFLIHTILV